MRSNFVRVNPRHAGITPYDAKMLQERFDTAARRADKSASQMLLVLENEIAATCRALHVRATVPGGGNPAG